MPLLTSTLRTTTLIPGIGQHFSGDGAGVGDPFWDTAGAVPSLDVYFSADKSLRDRISGQNLITFGRAGGTATYVDATGAIVTAAANEPRFTHDPVTLRSLGLLVEEQRTNGITNNTMVGAAAGTPGTLPTGWGVFVSPTGLTRTIVGSGTVNGINYIDVRFAGTPSSTGEITLYLSPATTATLAQAWTSTAWLSLAGGSTSNIAAISLRNFELNSGAYVREIGTNVVSSISSNLVRRQNITTSFGASANQIQLALSLFATAANTPIDITLRIGFPQLEQGAFATSVIPTTGTQATRNADVATITGAAFSSWYRQDEGTFYWSSAAGGSAGNAFEVSNGTANNRITGFNNGSTQPVLLIGSGGVNVFLSPGTIAANSRNAHAAAYKANNNAYSLNGSNPATDSTNLPPAGVSMLAIGANSFLSGYLNGTISRLTYWPQPLPTKLQAITA